MSTDSFMPEQSSSTPCLVILPKLEEPLELKISTFELFVNYSNYSNSWVRIALFGIGIRSFFRNRIYSVFGIRCIFKIRIYSVFGIRSDFTIRDNTDIDCKSRHISHQDCFDFS